MVEDITDTMNSLGKEGDWYSYLENMEEYYYVQKIDNNYKAFKSVNGNLLQEIESDYIINKVKEELHE